MEVFKNVKEHEFFGLERYHEGKYDTELCMRLHKDEQHDAVSLDSGGLYFIEPDTRVTRFEHVHISILHKRAIKNDNRTY